MVGVIHFIDIIDGYDRHVVFNCFFIHGSPWCRIGDSIDRFQSRSIFWNFQKFKWTSRSLGVRVMLVSFNMFPQAARVGVPFRATRHFALIRLFHRMGSGVLKPIAGIGVRFAAPRYGADIWFFAAMRARVNLEVLGARKRFVALETPVRFLVGVSAYVDEHLVPAMRTNSRLDWIIIMECSQTYLALNPLLFLVHPSQLQWNSPSAPPAEWHCAT